MSLTLDFQTINFLVIKSDENRRPGKLFENLQHIRVVIPIIEVGMPTSLTATTGYVKFYSHCRNILFQNISYYLSQSSRKAFSVLKIRTAIENSIAEKVWSMSKTIQCFESCLRNNNYVYYGYGYGYFGKILNKKSYFWGENVKESTGDKYYFPVFVMRYPNQTLPIRRPADIAPVAEYPCAALSLRA